jgi:hypothetical protein
MLKRAISALIVTAVTALAVMPVCAEENKQRINVQINGEYVSFMQQQPVIVQGRTLVPIRGVFEKLGYTISWEANTKKATLADKTDVIRFEIGAKKYEHNGTYYELEVPAQIINSSTMLPLRAVSEATGTHIEWEARTKTVKITTTEAESSSHNYSDFVEQYTAIVNSLSAVDTVMSDLYTVNEDNINQKMSKLRTEVNNAKVALNLARTRLYALDTPNELKNFRNLSIQAVEGMSDLFTMMGDIFNQNLSAERATEKVQQLLKQAKALNADVASSTVELAK